MKIDVPLLHMGVELVPTKSPYFSNQSMNFEVNGHFYEMNKTLKVITSLDKFIVGKEKNEISLIIDKESISSLLLHILK